MGDDRPPAYWEDDLLVIRASAIGSCMWELVAHAQQKDAQPYPEFLLAAFARGNELEPIVIDRLRKLGWKFDPQEAQAEGNLRVGANRVVRFHPDGVAVPATFNDKRLVEVKSAAHSQFEKGRRHGIEALFPEYPWQLSVMMHGLGLPAVWVLVDKETDELHMQWVDTPPVSLGEIVTRAKEVYEGSLGDDIVLTDRPCERPDQFPCRFIHLRPEPEREVREMEAITTEDLDAFETAAMLYAASRETEAQAKKDKEECRKALLEICQRYGDHADADAPPMVASSLWRVAWNVSTRHSVDHKAMEKDGIDVDSYTEEKTSVSIQVVGADA